MLFAGIFFVLFILELFYFKIAAYFNIIDAPNTRSSHSISTLRGGGIIFPISVLVYFAVFGFHYFAFGTGLILLAIVCFADDIKPQRKRLRAAVQILAVLLLLYEAGIFSYPWLMWVSAAIFIVAMLNAYNFMDGINGITASYSFNIIAALFFLNRQLRVFDEDLLLCMAAGNLVFTYFNFRKNARCFAGDTGSVCMAYMLLFLTLLCVLITSNIIFILFYALYIIDVALTIAQRLYFKENIFEPHRKHLFQYLANEKNIPQLWVSILYMLIQGIISAGVLYVWKRDASVQWIFAASVTGVLLSIYTIIKYRIIRQLEMMAKQ